MKSMLCLFLGLVVATATYSQVLINGFRLPDTTLGLLTTSGGSVRSLQPDHMPCLVPDLARVERMPVLRLSYSDPMPNGFLQGRGWSLEVRPDGQKLNRRGLNGRK